MKYGWRPSLPDFRDDKFKFEASTEILMAIPKKVDLRDLPFYPEVYNQFGLGSCTAQMAAALVQISKIRQGDTKFKPARRFNYYTSGILEGTEKVDCGRYNRDALKAVNQWGVPDEETWPYIVEEFDREPTKEAFSEAEENQSIIYRAVQQNLAQIRGCLSMGYPVGFGFTVFSNFEGERTSEDGVLDMPDPERDGQRGGHAVVMVGYDDLMSIRSLSGESGTIGAVLVRNSYGKRFGLEGHFWMPYEYILHRGLCADMWMIERME